MKACSKCGEPHNRKHYWCADCHATNMREWRKTHKLNSLARFKDTARSYANVYLKRGKIIEGSCTVCGEKAEMHHPDYTKPLQVVWLCRGHHLELHKVT